MRVAEVPEDYSPRDADVYFDNSPGGYTFGQGNQCATYDVPSEGMTNVIIVCADFTLTSGTERICSMSKNVRPKVRFMTVTRKNRGRRRQAATTTRARGSGGPFVGRLLQESSVEEENALDLSIVQSDLDSIRVVPNPYVMTNMMESAVSNPFLNQRRKIMFTHIPANCIIKIFTVSGVLVDEIIVNNEPSNGIIHWDMLTRENLEVAAGMYVYHIDALDIGEEKLGKFAIIK